MTHHIDTAVILAAGMGTRLRQRFAGRPKAFLELGERPIIEESIERLVRCGIRRVVVVTGYRSEWFDVLAQRRGEIVTVHNSLFAESGSMYSLACAAPIVQDDFLLLESDLVYEPRALESLLAHPERDCVLLSGPTGAGDEVFVAGDAATIRGMSKDRTALTSIVGELVGISKISQSLFATMLEDANERFSKSLHVSYETDCLAAVAARHPVPYCLVEDLLWGEIDDEQHFLRVHDKIYPAIAAAEQLRAARDDVERNRLEDCGPACGDSGTKIHVEFDALPGPATSNVHD